MPAPDPEEEERKSNEPTSAEGSGPHFGPGGGRRVRDSLFGEPIKKTWEPRAVPPPLLGRIAACMLGAISVVTTCFALAVSRVLAVPTSGMLALAAWLAILATAAHFGPSWWRRDVRVVLTGRHVIWRRGRLRRSIDRRTITFARIHWHRSATGVGDLELVRAVPTGALRRTLSITLPDLEAPDAVWAQIRGVHPTDALGDGARPLGQRLDPTERVLWTEKPQKPDWDVNRYLTLGVSGLSGLAGVRAVIGGVHALRVVVRAGLPPVSAPFGAMVLGIAISVAAVLFTAALSGYYALLRPGRLNHATRYVVTDRRVLIQRGSQELHLDRDRIVDVIDAPKRHGLHDLFLVLGGHNAHAHALAGAFGERVNGANGDLLPVLRAVHDSETVRAILGVEREAA